MKYSEAIKALVSQAQAEKTAIENEIAETKTMYKQGRISNETYQIRMSNLNREASAHWANAVRAMQDVKAQHDQAVDAWTILDATKIHPDAQIFTSGVPLTQFQFSALVQKHRDNAYMVGVMKEYAKAHEGLYSDYLATPEQRKADFGVFTARAIDAARSPASISAALFESGNGVPESVSYNYPDKA